MFWTYAFDHFKNQGRNYVILFSDFCSSNLIFASLVSFQEEMTLKSAILMPCFLFEFSGEMKCLTLFIIMSANKLCFSTLFFTSSRKEFIPDKFSSSVCVFTSLLFSVSFIDVTRNFPFLSSHFSQCFDRYIFLDF